MNWLLAYAPSWRRRRRWQRSSLLTPTASLPVPVKKPNEKQCWTRYDVIGTSKNNRIITDLSFHSPKNPDDATDAAYNKLVHLASTEDIPWDPFNLTIILHARP